MTATSIARAGGAAGVRPPGWEGLGGVLAGVLVFDGLLSLALEVLYLPTYLGATPFPITLLVAAVVNVLLVMGMGVVASRPAALALPLLAWLLGYLICATGGPGGDVMLTDSWTSPALLACGLIPAGFYLFRRTFLRPRP
ncbi:hypothetical protein BJY24_001380 [Nocardia transvalensis]|uniref:Uncharacterized protein n=1 Tax=Nocardia transvalensis TaxID=37333 RepID=A0A7W9UGQ3_9NOCA|nr:hypothetical protein [Nocardia transvalensis]MBB5912513.1 hypothetical protein [Nocardia transvalensis]